jgi:hypothetical protein
MLLVAEARADGQVSEGDGMPSCTSPAEAGAQLGDAADEGWRFVIATLRIGPRPLPGWCYSPGWCHLADSVQGVKHRRA